MSYNNYNDHVFRNKLDICLEKIKLLLEANKSNLIQPANDVEHRYEDKYLLANYLTNITLSSILNTFSHLGLTSQVLQTLQEWSKQKEVSIRFEAIEKCEFVKETKREVEDPVKFEKQKSGISFSTTTVSRAVVTVTEYVYSFSSEYRISAFRGVGEHDQDGVELVRRSNLNHSIILRAKECPYPASRKVTHDVNISLILRNIKDKLLTPSFEINRSSKECYTPRQNEDVKKLLTSLHKLKEWGDDVEFYFKNSLFNVVTTHRDPATGNQPLPDLTLLNTSDVFLPIVPLFQDTTTTTTNNTDTANAMTIDSDSHTSSSSIQIQHHGSWRNSGSGSGVSSTDLTIAGATSDVVLSDTIQTLLVAEQSRSLEDKLIETKKHFPEATTSNIISQAEVTIVISTTYILDIVSYYTDSLNFIEDMLRKQVVAAVGKELTAKDFAEYMKFHNRRLFKPEFQPKPFSHSIRRSVTHSPEGTLRIQELGSVSEPINTVSCTAPEDSVFPMQFVLNASTNVTFGGERTLHACLLHKFSSGPSVSSLQLVTEARQYSSYIVLIGRIASATLFEPKYGMIVQNKDEITIPLDLQQIPTPKEFKDAIKSLSPEQQRFAQAYRSMQLESTLFGICVIQIKPQLEKLLKLHPDSLTKEIRLTQDLMELFIKYQIPSDLLTFDGNETADATARLTAVKGHVKAIQDMIEDSKKKEVEQQKQQREYEGKEGYDDEESVDVQPQSGTYQSKPMFKKMSRAGGGGIPMHMANMMAFSSAPANDMMMMDACGPPPPMPMPVAAPSRRLASTASLAGPSPGVYFTKQSMSSAQQQQQQQQQSQSPRVNVTQSSQQPIPTGGGSTDMDYTQYPSKLDKAYEVYDVDSALRPTIINPSNHWTKKSQKRLLDSPTTTYLNEDSLGKEKNAAFDLLDALSRSGALTIDNAALHVVIAATHCFDNSLMDTIVQKNVNPIERVERSVLIMASTIHGVPSTELITDAQVGRVSTYSPMLFIGNEQHD